MTTINMSRRPRVIAVLVAAALALALAAVAVATSQTAEAAPGDRVAAGGGNQDCPEGTVEIAKFEVTSSGEYVLESGSGVSVSGGLTSAEFTSDQPVSAVVVKGSTDAKVVTYDPPVTSGSFDNSGLVNPGGQTPDISNVRFCGGVPYVESPS